jgi:hypothetical protein
MSDRGYADASALHGLLSLAEKPSTLALFDCHTLGHHRRPWYRRRNALLICALVLLGNIVLFAGWPARTQWGAGAGSDRRRLLYTSMCGQSQSII